MASVFIGGSIGALARWGIVEMVGAHGDFPSGTFTANLIGVALLGFLAGRLSIRVGITWNLVGVGLAGALTTFSGFVVEGVLIIESTGLAPAMFYVGASVVAGLWVASVARNQGAKR